MASAQAAVCIITMGENKYFHLGVLMAMNSLGITEDDVTVDSKGHVHLGEKVVIPVNEDGHALIHFAGKWREVFRHVSYLEILSAYQSVLAGEAPPFDLTTLKDTVALVGLTATGTHDVNPVPTDHLYPQVGIHADVYNNILHQRFITRFSRGVNLLVVAFLALIAIGLSRIPQLFLSVGSAVLIWLALILAAVALFRFQLLWMDLFYPSISFGVVYFSAIIRRTMNEKRKRELLEVELSIASRIQRSFLPTEVPQTDLLMIEVFMQPAEHVGGDLYDVFKLDENRTGIMCGDVSGKGIPAALFMARSVAEFKFHSSGKDDPAEVLQNLNESMAKSESGGLFVTMNYAIVDTLQNKLTLSTGGHNPVVQVRADGRFKLLDPAGGLPIGVMRGVDFGKLTLDLEAGDVYVLYSDGISEARDRHRQDYEIDRLVPVVQEHRALDAQAIKGHILKSVREFVGSAPQHDDMTLIVLKVHD